MERQPTSNSTQPSGRFFSLSSILIFPSIATDLIYRRSWCFDCDENRKVFDLCLKMSREATWIFGVELNSSGAEITIRWCGWTHEIFENCWILSLQLVASELVDRFAHRVFARLIASILIMLLWAPLSVQHMRQTHCHKWIAFNSKTSYVPYFYDRLAHCISNGHAAAHSRTQPQHIVNGIRSWSRWCKFINGQDAHTNRRRRSAVDSIYRHNSDTYNDYCRTSISYQKSHLLTIRMNALYLRHDFSLLISLSRCS